MWKPYKDIDWAKFERYVQASVPQIKIAEVFGVTRDTLRRRAEDHYGIKYDAIYASLHSEGDALLHAVQMQKALNGNIQMLMFLGKVRLGQQEAQQVVATEEANKLLEGFKALIDDHRSDLRRNNEESNNNNETKS